MLITTAFHEKPHGGQDAVSHEQPNIQTQRHGETNRHSHFSDKGANRYKQCAVSHVFYPLQLM